MLYCKVAGLLITVQADALDFVSLDSMHSFLTEKEEGRGRLFNVAFSDDLEVCGTLLKGKVFMDEGVYQIYSHQDYYYIKLLDDHGDRPPSIMRISTAYDEAVIRARPGEWLTRNYKNHPYLTNKDFLNFVFRMAILHHQGLVLHASAVKYAEGGYAFLGKSGAGKTTHTDLWIRYFNARKLNDDSPAIRFIEGKPVIYGTPWSGSVDCYVNDSAPLKGLCMLKQSRENRISRLEPVDAFVALFPMCFYSIWDQRIIDLTISNLNKLVQTTPVYLLECRPNEEAAELAWSVMK